MSNPITKRIVYYDTEIINAIPVKGKPLEPNIEYCAGWGDFAGMGISCLCAYVWPDKLWYVFTDAPDGIGQDSAVPIHKISPLTDFDDLIAHADHVIGFNNHRFDDKLLRSNDIGVTLGEPVSRDLLTELWLSMGLSLSAFTKFHGGSKLDDLALHNLDIRKTGDGALAPVRWQQGFKNEVVLYCLNDVEILRRLCDIVHNDGGLKHSNGNYYNMKSLYE